MWLQHVQRMATNTLPKQSLQYKPKDEGTQDDRGGDGGTNFILSIKKQEKRLTLQEHDDYIICSAQWCNDADFPSGASYNIT